MRFFIMLMMVTVLASCGSSKLLGSRTPPDETQVIDGPSLAVPPDFALRPPSDAEDYEAVLRAQKTREAQAIIVGGEVSASVPGVVADDQWLLQKVGAGHADIRATLEKDNAGPVAEDEKSFWQRIMGSDKKE